MRQSSTGLAGLLILTLLVGLGGGVLLDRTVLRPQPPAASLTGSPPAAPDATASPGTLDYGLLNQAWQLVNQHYVDRPALQSQPLTYGAIRGMVDALGDTGHSRFQTPAEVTEQQSLNQGSFEGIGVEVEMKNDQVMVIAPIDGTPAQKAGIRAGDVILQVNGKSLEGQTLDTVISQVLGPAGTPVTLTILTPSTNQTRDVTITRARIVLHDVTWQPIPGTTLADLRIAEFSNGVGRDLQAALAAIEQQKLTGIVLDLRNNPGGLLNEGVTTASAFLPGGNVLEEKDAQGHVTTVPEDSRVPTTNLPLVVLINEGTASAAEIVSGAIQDAHRGPLVGATTFGTGTVLTEFPLSDGSSLLLAIEEWLTPSGRVIWHHGVVPDQAVPLPPTADLLGPDAEQGLTPAQVQASGDTQLLAAIQLLTSGTPVATPPK